MRYDIKEAMDRYAETGCPTGDFLRAVLENNLTEAFRRADKDNTRDMKEIVGYVYNELPHNCHGSPKAVWEWLNRFRLEREELEKEGEVST